MGPGPINCAVRISVALWVAPRAVQSDQKPFKMRTTLSYPRLVLLILTATCLGGFCLPGCSKKSSGGGGDHNTTSPSARISDVTQNRQNSPSQYRFYVDMSAASGKSVSIGYTTVAGTARATTDFTPASGTLTIPAG